MRKKKGFILHQVCDQNIVIAEGRENVDFNSVIAMNPSSSFLWSRLPESDPFTLDDMQSLLTSEYDVAPEQALADCRELADAWLRAGIITP